MNQRKKVLSDDIDFVKLSQKTDNYVCSDIKLIVNDASRVSFEKNKTKISQEILELIINQTSPSITQLRKLKNIPKRKVMIKGKARSNWFLVKII